MKKHLLSLFMAVIGLTAAGGAWATPEDRAAAKFLLFQPSARSAGMGEAFIALADDANATYYNPAALADDTGRNLSTTFYRPVPRLATDIFTSFGAYTQPFGGVGNLGFSLIYTSLGTQFRRDQQGNDLGEFTSFGLALGVSYGTYFTKTMSLGVTVKLVHSNLASQGAGNEQGKGSGTTFAGDLGFLWKANDRFALAWVLRNLGPNITFIDADQADPLPQNFTVGFIYKILDGKNSSVLFSTDIYKPLADEGFSSFITGWADSRASEEFKDIDYHTGLEWSYNLSDASAFALRSGYTHDTDGNRKALTFGLGLNYDWASFDLSYFVPTNKDRSAFGEVFRFSFGLNLEHTDVKREMTNGKR